MNPASSNRDSIRTKIFGGGRGLGEEAPSFRKGLFPSPEFRLWKKKNKKAGLPNRKK